MPAYGAETERARGWVGVYADAVRRPGYRGEARALLETADQASA